MAERSLRGTAPDWTVDGIVGPTLRIVNDSTESRKIRAEAQRIGDISASKPGRYVAADEIAKVVLMNPNIVAMSEPSVIW